jgi:hypothetical protein
MIREYETQSTLNPKLWKDGQLRPKLRVAFMKIAKSFYNFLEVDTPILDVIIIGSSANYNWTEHSDIDLHVVINYMDVNNNMHLVNNYMHAKKSIWNTNYPLTYKGMNIELYAQDLNQEMHSTVGSYSLLHNKWIQKPKADVISIDDVAIQQKADPYEYEIDSLNETDPNIELKITNIKNRLQHLRKTGLAAEGEYSIENLAFKHLRNKGYLERLKRLEHKVKMGYLAVESASHERNSNSTNNIVAETLINHVTRNKIMDSADWKQIIHHTKAVTDPRGQWEHPGQCTVIPTTDGSITMKQVPFKVFAIDNTGYSEMMLPEQEYQFPGKLVFEIPHTAQWQTLIMQIQNSIQNGAIDAKW